MLLINKLRIFSSPLNISNINFIHTQNIHSLMALTIKKNIIHNFITCTYKKLKALENTLDTNEK
jgi:hypothetical protein